MCSSSSICWYGETQLHVARVQRLTEKVVLASAVFKLARFVLYEACVCVTGGPCIVGSGARYTSITVSQPATMSTSALRYCMRSTDTVTVTWRAGSRSNGMTSVSGSTKTCWPLPMWPRVYAVSTSINDFCVIGDNGLLVSRSASTSRPECFATAAASRTIDSLALCDRCV